MKMNWLFSIIYKCNGSFTTVVLRLYTHQHNLARRKNLQMDKNTEYQIRYHITHRIILQKIAFLKNSYHLNSLFLGHVLGSR